MAAERDVFRETAGRCRAGEATCRETDFRHNLIDEGRLRGSGSERRSLRWTCALGNAEDGPVLANDIAELLGVTRQCIALVEARAITKVRRTLALRGG